MAFLASKRKPAPSSPGSIVHHVGFSSGVVRKGGCSGDREAQLQILGEEDSHTHMYV